MILNEIGGSDDARCMIVVIQDLVILFAGALEHMFCPSLVRFFQA